MRKLLYIIPLLVLVGLLIVPSAAAESVTDLSAGCSPQPGCDPVPGDPSTEGVQPVVVPGNPCCATTEGCGNNLKIESVKSGEYTSADGQFKVTITVSTDKKYFSWTANRWVCAVIVKGGNQANVYTYAGQSSDGNLHAPLIVNPQNCHISGLPQISHIEFCYDEPTNPAPEYPTIILVAAGLLGLGGFVLLRNRKHSQKTA